MGDLNDGPEAEPLQPLVNDQALNLVNGLAGAVPDRAALRDDPPAPDQPWTHRFKPTRQPAEYELFDHIWLSPAADERLTGAGMARRTRLTGNGSDHDPAWVDLDI